MAPRLPPPPFLYPIVDVSALGGRSVGAAVADLCRGGARILQFRGKGLPDGRFLALAREGLQAARQGGAFFIVNDRPDVARILEADGVHLGQDDLPPRMVRELLGPAALIGVSTHNVGQLDALRDEPVDYAAIGPVFPTRSKANPDPVVGLDLVTEARRRSRRPLVAIGGITRENAASVIAAGADGVAVISDLLRQADLAEATRGLGALLQATARTGY